MLSYCGSDRPLAQVAQEVVESLSLETHTQKLSGCDPLELALLGLLEPSVGPDVLQRCLPTSAALQFCTVLSGVYLLMDLILVSNNSRVMSVLIDCKKVF